MPFAAGHAGFPVGELGNEELTAVGCETTERGLLLGNSCSAVDAREPVDGASPGLDVTTGAAPAVLPVTASEIVDIVICGELELDITMPGFEFVDPWSRLELETMAGACELCTPIPGPALDCTTAGLDPTAAALLSAGGAGAEALDGLVLASTYSGGTEPPTAPVW